MLDTHLLRHIDRFVEPDGLRRELLPFYSEMGRPSIDPGAADSDADRQLLLRYCSERRLCEEVHLNLAYRFFGGHGVSIPFVQCGHQQEGAWAGFRLLCVLDA